MREADPSVFLRGGYTGLGIVIVDVQVLKPGEEEVVAQKLKSILTR